MLFQFSQAQRVSEFLGAPDKTAPGGVLAAEDGPVSAPKEQGQAGVGGKSNSFAGNS
jgi:hypothetical protein